MDSRYQECALLSPDDALNEEPDLADFTLIAAHDASTPPTPDLTECKSQATETWELEILGGDK